MKRRVVSWLMTVVMLLSLLPTSVWAETTYDVAQDTTPQTTSVETPAEPDEGTEGADEPTAEAAAPLLLTAGAMPAAVSDVTVINTAEDFAAMAYNGNYKLGADIEVTTPYRSKFSGTFDGDGHTVKLTLNVTSGNAALFGEVNGATIKNVLVEADVTSSVAGAYYGTGGLIGYVSGATTVENCGVTGSVGNTVTGSWSTVYIGGLIGYCSSVVTIKNCYSAAVVSSAAGYSSCRAGGLVGSLSGGSTMENCYVTGSVTAAAGYTGGLTGYAYGSSSSKINISNCYVAATVSGSGSNVYAVAYNGGYYTTFTNCCYDSEVAGGTKALYSSSNDVIAKTTSELKGLADTLGSAFQSDTTSLNNGYPILEWQVPIDPNAAYTVTFEVEPKNSVLTWNGAAQPASDDGTYIFQNIKVGDCPISYTVSNEAGDYAAQSGTVSVRNKDVTVHVSLKLNEHTLTFTGLPEDAALTVKDSEGNTVSANSDGSYSVVNGEYSYTATAFGYEEVTGTVTVDRQDQQVAVTMDAAEGAQVTFKNADKGTLTVKAKINSWTAITMTDTNGVYTLPFGYTYDWTFTSDNYIDQSGSYEAKDSEKSATITIPLSAKPTKNADGDYEITTADQLRWLAQQVNSAGYSNTDKYNAVLTEDIDLGSENWMPIGKSSSYAYKGTFDGQGHEIRNLSITGSASSNYGLFGYVSGGSVKNLTVSGTISLTGTGSSSYGAAGIVGNLTGKNATVENCKNSVNVTGQQNAGGIVGYISGGYGSEPKSVTGCVNTGNITSNSHNAGGIVGYINGQVTVDSCYNTAAITSGSYRAGGITAYLNSSYAAVKNCYSTGNISVTSGTDVHSIVGKKYSGAVNDCYYLDTATADSNATAKTSAELKALASTLGDAFTTGNKNINDGYPILKWQIPTYEVAFSVTPADAVVTVNGETLEGSTAKLPDGSYSYTVSAFGYETKTGSITVSGKAVTEFVSLTKAATKNVTFSITPLGIDARITVTWNGDGKTAVAPVEGVYTLPYGEYTYTVKAKGYGAVSDSFTVDTNKPVGGKIVVSELQPTTAWDGETTEAPDGSGTQTAPYTVESGAQLAWLAEKVNADSSGTKLYVKLTDDIDLGDKSFTPIGDSSKPFSGEFDGNGYTISGLNVSGVEYAGLFGVIKDATIRNVVVQGTVSGTSDAGGIVGRAVGTTNDITNCGNEATVSVNSSSGGYAGGILGNNQNYSTAATISGCYNSGAVTSKGSTSYSRAGGIIGRSSGSSVTIANCYNTAAVSSDAYAAGIYAGSGVAVTKSYNAGTITGASGKAGAFTTGKSDTLTDCYYLAGSVSANSVVSNATALSAAEMQSELLTKLGDSWKTARGVNGGMPVLQWQQADEPDGTVTLAKNAQFEREDVTSLDGEVNSLAVSTLKWTAVDKAESYTVSLWRSVKTRMALSDSELKEYEKADTALDKLAIADENIIIAGMSDDELEQLANYDEKVTTALAALEYNGSNDRKVIRELLDAEEAAQQERAQFIVSAAEPEELGYYIAKLEWAKDIPGVEGTDYDLAAAFAELPEGVYYASVAAEENGQAAYASMTQVKKEVVGVQSAYDRMKAVTNLAWDGTKATWDKKEGFTANQTYSIDLYTVTGEGDTREYELYKSFLVAGKYTSVELANTFAVNTSYAFTVTALSDSELVDRLGVTDSLVSGYSPVYAADTGERPAEKVWVDISSAEQWIELANTEDVPSDGSGSDSRQKIEWSKNYRLVSDIDFSTLSAAYQTKTKSVGTVTYPFMGELDGQGHKITGLTLSNNDSGLFWYIGATGYIHDVTIDSANVLFSDNAAVLANNNRGIIENCAVLNTNITADTGAVLGGMVSRNYGIIRNSYVQGGTLTSNTTTATGHAGFVGANEEGGLIEQCWTSMTVSTQSNYAGGFVGLGYGGTIRNCFALGSVSAGGYSGGFVGRSVYEGNVYENCYAAGVVTVTGAEGNGFIGGNQPWSGFQNDQSEGVTNCYYNGATRSSHDYGAKAKSLEEMKSAAFLTAVSGSESGVWSQDADKNDGLPYLTNVKAPESTRTTQITVQIAIATYDKTTYAFFQMGETISFTMDSNGNTRVVDLMDAAVEQGKLAYEYAITSTFGRFIHTINGYAVDAPDGWMFTVNDTLSNVSASLATVKDGDKLLWFEGTTENHFQGPTWEQLSNPTEEWVDINTVEQLIELAKATDAETLDKNYRLTADLDLNGKAFNGIGSASAPFTGKFDGQGHTVKNVTVTGTNNVGFFNVIRGATITNLTLDSVDVSGQKNVGGLVGHAQVYLNSSDLSKNVANLIGSCTVSGAVSGSVSVGGLVGLNGGKSDSDTGFSIASSVNNSHADVAVTGIDNDSETISDSNNKIGGLVGDNSGAVTDSSATGAVQGATMVGGLVGSNSGSIYGSHAEGEVEGDGNVGGFVGLTTGTIKQCYSLGAVSGSDYTGGFGGSVSGTVDTAMSAGSVNGSMKMRSAGYIGGFAGYLEGILAGLDNQITVKNVYGNCTGSLPAVGNTAAYGTGANGTAVEKMKLTSMPDVSTKIHDLFGVYLPVIQNGLDTFHDVTVAYGTAKNTALALGTVPEGCTVSYDMEDNSYIYVKSGQVKLKQDNEVTVPVSVQVRVTLTATDDSCGEKTVTVRLLPAYTQLLHTLAQSYQNTDDQWAAMDMMAYSKLNSAKYSLSDNAKQNVINALITKSAESEASVSDRSRIEIVLRALGINSTRLTPANSAAVVNNAKKLSSVDFTALSYYTAPYVLLADMQGNVKLTTAQVSSLIKLLVDNAGEDGLFGYEWGGVYYASPDTAATALAALQPYVATNTAAKDLADKLCAGLKSYFAANGTFGNANSDAMVIIGLIAAGEDPYDVKTVDGKTVVDALLLWGNATNSAFQYPNWLTGVMEDNALATEQGFRALVALEQFNANGKTAYNIYDFSKTAVKPGQATGSGTAAAPEEPEGGETITVSVTVSAPNGTWLSKSVEVKEGSTVFHAFIKALEGSGITQQGASSGYVSSMTKNGVTYGEFTHGENSGWLYKVNGALPNVGLTAYTVKNGDSIYWYYTADWKTDPDAGKMAEDEVTAEDVIKHISAIGTVTLDSGSAINAARMAYNKLSATEKAKVTNYSVLTAAEAAYAALLKAAQEEKKPDAGTTAATDWKTPYQSAAEAAAAQTPVFGDEWTVIALARSGISIPASYYESVVKAVQDAGGVLSDNKYTEYSRTILALTAIGKDPTDVGGYDLLEKLADMDKVTYQGINGAIFALLALDSGNYDVPTAADGATQTSREALVDYLLASQLDDGGWALSGTAADTDITAMTLQALAPYRTGDSRVGAAVDAALETLSGMQLADGGFGSWGTVNSESAAQVIIALTALDIDPATDSRFLKNGFSVLDALCAFYRDDGFAHVVDGETDAMATEQALCALAAYERFTGGRSGLYDMADAEAAVLPVQPEETEQNGETGTSVVLWVALGATAAAGGAVLILRRKRS